MCNAGYTADNPIVYYYSATTLTRPNERAKDERRSGIPRTLKKKNIGVCRMPIWHFKKKQKRREFKLAFLLIFLFSSPVASHFSSFVGRKKKRVEKSSFGEATTPTMMMMMTTQTGTWIMMMMMTPFTRAHHTSNILTHLRTRWC